MAAVSTRPPLEDTTNSPSSSPIATPSIRSTSPSLRRKRTQRNLTANLDSSESFPSIDSSIYNASLEQDSSHSEIGQPRDTDWDDTLADWNRPLLGDDVEAPASWENTVVGPDGSPVPATFLHTSVSPRDHTPHKLDPIKEQNSLATLQSPNSTVATIRPSNRSRSRSRSPAPTALKRSLSLSDLPPPREEHPRSSLCLSPPPSPLLQPIRPLYLPPERSPTPPNLPSFGTRVALTYLLPPPSSPSKRASLRQTLGSPTAGEREWRRQTVGLPKGVVMRGEDGTLVHGRFRPINNAQVPPQGGAHSAVNGTGAGEGSGRRSRRQREGEREDGGAREGPWLGGYTGTGAVRTEDLERRRDDEGREEEERRVSKGGWRKVKEKIKGRMERRKKGFRRFLVACCLCEADGEPVRVQPAREMREQETTHVEGRSERGEVNGRVQES